MDKIFKDSKWDYAIICKNCGHISEQHEFDDFDGWSCIMEGCNCNKFEPKVNEKNEIQYLEGEINEV